MYASVFVLGFLPCFNSWRKRISYVAAVLLGSSLLPLLPGLELGAALFNAISSVLLCCCCFICCWPSEKGYARPATILLLIGPCSSLLPHSRRRLPKLRLLVRIQNFQPQPILCRCRLSCRMPGNSLASKF